MTATWPQNVGIRALEVYFPAQYVDQEDLEKFDGVSAGKYTIGLGQSRMGFCNDREDVNSLCLTVLHRLLERYHVEPRDVGRLEVGTETIIDKSKSVKSVLMQLFEPHGCIDLEGIDTTNACYGGTAALFNAIAWMESSYWDGRLAVVVCADNAIYAAGSARPTGGTGAIAMLIGPDAPLVFDRRLRASCMKHAYDFYKPDLKSEFPLVDGKLSIQCYLNAVDECYRGYCEKVASETCSHTRDVSLGYLDYVVFHSPYCKLVQKSFARLAFNDFLRNSKDAILEEHPDLGKFSDKKLEETYFDRDVEKAFMGSSKLDFQRKTQPTLLLANQVGNMYTPSVYSGLISLLINKPLEELAGKRVGVFSYGSGLASSMFSLKISEDASKGSSLQVLTEKLRYVKEQLDARRRVSPEEYTKTLDLREKNCHAVPFEPSSSVENMFPGTYYLHRIDELYRRTYKRVPSSDRNSK